MDRPVSDELRRMLSRQEMRGATVGAVKPHAMKWANDLLDREGYRRNGNLNARVRIVRARPFLAVIEGGKR